MKNFIKNNGYAIVNPLSSIECITPVSAAHLVCRNCGYKETLNESSVMCAAAGIPIWLIKK